MVNAWQVLDIEPTDDLSKIKKAYSMKLKIHHPEDDPEGYQALREAFDLAKKEAKRGIEHSDVSESTRFSEPTITLHEEGDYEEKADTSFRNQDTYSIENSNPISEFMEKVEKVYHNFQERINEEKWLELLDDKSLWDMQQRARINDALFYFLQENHLLPKRIWSLLEDHFDWDQSMNSNEPDFNDQNSTLDYLNYLRNRLQLHPNLSYDYIAEVDGINYDEFLLARETAYQLIFNGQWEEAETYLTQANQLFSRDPDTSYLLGLVYFNMDRFFDASIALREVTFIQPERMDALLLLARSHYELGHMDDAERVCKGLLESNPEDCHSLSLLGKIKMKQNRLKEARKAFKQVQLLDPTDAEATIYLANIIKKLSMTPGKGGLSSAEIKAELYQYSFTRKFFTLFYSSFKFHFIFSLILFSLSMVSLYNESERLDTNMIFLAFVSIMNILPNNLLLPSSVTEPALVCVIIITITFIIMFNHLIKVKRTLP